MKHAFLFFLFFFFSVFAMAIQPTLPIGAKANAMGGVSLLPTDFWSVFNNPAGLASQHSFAGGLAFDSYFAIDKNLSLKSAAILLPTNSGTFGLNLNYFGFSAYHEQKIGLAFGKQLGEKISVGIQLDYLSVSIGNDLGNASAFTFELAMIAQLTESLSLASYIYNPLAVKIGKINPEITPAIFKLAAAYKIDDALLLVSEYEQGLNDRGMLKVGMEYQLIEQIFVRGGLSTNPNLFSFGFGLNLKGMAVDFGTTYHQTLGFSPKVGMYYRIN